MTDTRHLFCSDSSHWLNVYETSESLCRIVAEFLGDGLRAQQPALAIVTPEHRAGIVNELRARNINVEAAQAAGDLLLVDVAETLDSFMVDSMPDAGLSAISQEHSHVVAPDETLPNLTQPQ